MLLFLLTFLCFAGLALAQALDPVAFSCAKFWPKAKGAVVGGKCQFFPGYPQTIGPTNVVVIYTASWRTFASSGGLVNTVSQALDEVLGQSIDLYDSLSSLPDEIIVILTTGSDAGLDSDSYADASYPGGVLQPCQIRVKEGWSERIADGGNDALQALAHEMYHCIQKIYIGIGPLSWANWVIEGSADFFSNVVFPAVNLEYDEDPLYDPNTPIYAQTKPAQYGTSLLSVTSRLERFSIC